MKINFILGAFCLLFTIYDCCAQNGPEKVIPASPNAASLGIYGQIPTTLFNGLAQLSIPLGSISSGDYSSSINLSYHGGGVKPNEHAGWVGLGWNLSTGGSITRKVNGGVDEVKVSGYTPPTIFSYYSNFASLNRTDWFSSTLLGAYTETALYSIPYPDEFIFNFSGYSGSFFYNHKGEWQVKSDQGLHLRIIEEVKDNFELAGKSSISLPRIFYKFTITAPDGTQFVFGGTSNSIEFSRSASSISNSDIIANTWNLTKVITAKGNEVSFNYERDGSLLLYMSPSFSLFKNENGSNFTSANANETSVSLINPVYLKEIETDHQKIIFSRSKSNELLQPYNLITNTQRSNLASYRDVGGGDHGEFDVNIDIKFQKLDKISFYSKFSGILKSVVFNYTELSNSRLMLDSLKEIGSKDDAKPPYIFKYIEGTLPPYTTRKVDHWGYYNGNDYLAAYLTPASISQLYNKSHLVNYYESRESNFNLMTYGTLKSVTYPTGGKSEFEYEPHQYSKIAKRYPFDVESVVVQSAGGLRIKKISDLGDNGVVLTKNYKYVKDYNLNGGTSSGILSGIPKYLEEGRFLYQSSYFNYWYWYSHPIDPLGYTNGNHVTYSEVTELLDNGGYTTFKYTNHDKAEYRDRAVLNGISQIPAQWLSNENISMAIDRGKPTQESVYHSSGKLQKVTDYKYGEFTNERENSSVRVHNVKIRTFTFPGFNIKDINSSAFSIYTFPRLLIEKTTKSVESNVTDTILTSVKYVYGNLEHFQPTLITESKSDGSETTTYNSYSGDYGSGTPFIDQMKANHRINYPIEQVSYVKRGSTKYIVSGKIFTYLTGGKGLIDKVMELETASPVLQSLFKFSNQPIGVLPETSPGQSFSPDLLYKTRLTYSFYDTFGNPLEIKPETGSPKVYIWSYKNDYPVAEIYNSDYATVRNILGETALNQFGIALPTTTDVESFLDPLRLQLPSAQILSYNYMPLIGMSSETDAKGLNTYYEYDSFQRLRIVKDHLKNVIKVYCYGYQGNVIDCFTETLYYNDEQSGLFTKSCAPGFFGVPVLYKVPSGTYSSTKSIEDANLAAMNDVSINGPDYADSNGICARMYRTGYFSNAKIMAQWNSGKSVPIVDLYSSATSMNYPDNTQSVFYEDEAMTITASGIYTLWENVYNPIGYKFYKISQGLIVGGGTFVESPGSNQ